MTPLELRFLLRKLALQYAKKRNLQIDTSHKSAIIFRNLEDNFHPASFANIEQNGKWSERTKKPHQNVSDTFEMQSSNSSDALLMNIFCHPQIGEWKGVRDSLRIATMNPVFGFKAHVYKTNHRKDDTAIDMVVDDLLVEANLTEADFTQKRISDVEQYEGLKVHFHDDCLTRHGDDCYDNYQIIRNLLAAIQHGKRHVLLCDERRPDLVRRYMETAACLRDINARRNSRVILWQEIQKVCGETLAQFLKEKYGFNDMPTAL